MSGLARFEGDKEARFRARYAERSIPFIRVSLPLAATLYLLLPYTAQMVGRVEHVLPAALIVWALVFYRRPIVSGAFLALATGAGSASRATIGVVVVAGVALSTVLSLYVVPAFYLLLAPYTGSPEAVAHELAQQEQAHPAGEEQPA